MSFASDFYTYFNNLVTNTVYVGKIPAEASLPCWNMYRGTVKPLINMDGADSYYDEVWLIELRAETSAELDTLHTSIESLEAFQGTMGGTKILHMFIVDMRSVQEQLNPEGSPIVWTTFYTFSIKLKD